MPSARFVLCKLSPSIESRPAELSPGIKCRCSRSSSTVLRVRASWSLPGLPGTLVLATFYCSRFYSRDKNVFRYIALDENHHQNPRLLACS